MSLYSFTGYCNSEFIHTPSPRSLCRRSHEKHILAASLRGNRGRAGIERGPARAAPVPRIRSRHSNVLDTPVVLAAGWVGFKEVERFFCAMLDPLDVWPICWPTDTTAERCRTHTEGEGFACGSLQSRLTLLRVPVYARLCLCTRARESVHKWSSRLATYSLSRARAHSPDAFEPSCQL